MPLIHQQGWCSAILALSFFLSSLHHHHPAPSRKTLSNCCLETSSVGWLGWCPNISCPVLRCWGRRKGQVTLLALNSVWFYYFKSWGLLLPFKEWIHYILTAWLRLYPGERGREFQVPESSCCQGQRQFCRPYPTARTNPLSRSDDVLNLYSSGSAPFPTKLFLRPGREGLDERPGQFGP